MSADDEYQAHRRREEARYLLAYEDFEQNLTPQQRSLLGRAAVPERLESLINQACHYAEWNLREYGQVPPSAMALTKDGIFLMSPSKIGTESEKDQFADAARMLAVGYRADAICMILESWAVFAKTPGQDITNCPPSQSPDRVELVAITGEIKGLSAQQFLMIERDVAGVFSGISNPMLPKYEELQGRFTGILPPREPKDNDAQMARFVLAGMGYIVEGKGTSPIWN